MVCPAHGLNMNVNELHNRIPLFGVSLHSECCEVFGLKKERLRERETHKGDGECLPETPMKIISLSSPKTWQPPHDLAKILTENYWPCANKAWQSVVHLYPWSKCICYKDQWGYLIIERCRNNQRATHSFKSFLTQGTVNTKPSQKWVFLEECMLCIIKKLNIVLWDYKVTTDRHWRLQYTWIMTIAFIAQSCSRL